MVLLHIPADDFLFLGLELMGFGLRNPPRTKKDVDRFLACFGTTPESASAIFDALQVTTNEKAYVKPSDLKFRYFMMTLNWMKSYQVEHVLAGLFKVHEDTVRKWTWFYTKRIQGLKEEKIRWDVLNDSEDFIPVSDDGVHCRLGEPRKQPSTKWSSTKFGKKAALTYEIAIAIRHNQVVLVNGPFPAAAHDMTMFNHPDGAGAKLRPGAKAIADRAYNGPQIAKRNEFDTPEVKAFKKRVRARHETFNGRIKAFNVLDTRFRHGPRKHKAVFEAICVIVQFDMETGRPLFHV